MDVLDALRREHPDVQFSWVLGASNTGPILNPFVLPADARRCMHAGADTFADLRAGKWKDSARFMAGAHIMVVARSGAPEPELTGCNATLVTVPGLDGTSSTAVRAALVAGDGDAASMVHPEVYKYIHTHGLWTVHEEYE